MAIRPLKQPEGVGAVHTKFVDKSPNKTERFRHYYMVDAMRRFELDMHNAIAMNGRELWPGPWHRSA